MSSSIKLISILKYLTFYLIIINLFDTKVLCEAEPKNELVDLNQKFVKRDSKDDSSKNDEDSKEKKGNLKKHDDDDEDEDDSHEKSHDKAKKVVIKENFGFIHAFFASLSVIVVSEIGDKTFFIAAIMAMKHPRVTVYIGAMFALGLMTFLSALLGNVITIVIPRTYTYYASSVLFALFGFKMLYEGWKMSANEHGDEEYEEAQETLQKTEDQSGDNTEKDVEMGGMDSKNNETKENIPEKRDVSRQLIVNLRKYVSPIFLQAFILTFLAEWGDRSQISTIILGARENILGTIIGGTLGHGLCTGAAVIGGRYVAQHISIRSVTLVGAFVFIFFACSAFFIGPGSD